MLQLHLIEKTIFFCVLLIYLVAAIVSVLQFKKETGRCRRLIISLIASAVSLEVVLLICRAVSLRAVPLTGLFESMIILSTVVGLTFLFLTIVIHEVWFTTVMIWSIFTLTVLAAFVAKPATELEEAAKTPWVVIHALAMTLSGAMITFSAVMSFLFLLCRRKLKHKEIKKVIGKMPNIERLENLNILGLKMCFVFLTYGFVSGMGLAAVRAASLHINFIDWFKDSKMVLIAVSWALLALILALKHMFTFKGKVVSRLTLLVFLLIVFGFIGSTLFCNSVHDFSSDAKIKQVNE